MASEYFKWKAKQEIAAEGPPAPARELTKKEKVLNWLYYHKLHLIAAAFVLWIVISMLVNILGIGQKRPDYRIAYVGGASLSEESVAALGGVFEARGEDLNRDKRVIATITPYVRASSADKDTELYYNYASDTVLLADITAGDSYFFLTDDPNGLQKAYQILANPDGSPPAEDDFKGKDKVMQLKDLPAFSEAGLEESVLNLYLGRRCFYEENVKYLEEYDRLWQLLLKE